MTTTTEAPAAGSALAIIESKAITPADAFKPGGLDAILASLAAEVRAIATDISTEKGRKAVASLAYKVARSKTALDDMGKDLVAGLKAQTAAVDAERKKARDFLDALKDEVRRPLDEYEAAEKARIEAHEAALAAITFTYVGYGKDQTAAEIADRLAHLENYPARDWQEFAARATKAIADEIERTKALLTAAQEREAQAAELERLRREEAERTRCEGVIRAFREAHEFGFKPNTADIERQLHRIEGRDIDVSEPYIERATVAKADAINRLAGMLEASRRADQEREDRIRQEAEEQAKRETEEANRRAAQAERDRLEAERRAEEAQAQAEMDRIAAAEEAARRERQRIEDERKEEQAAAARREADKAHRGTINRAALDALVAEGLSEAAARTAVEAIAKGKVPNVVIRY